MTAQNVLKTVLKLLTKLDVNFLSVFSIFFLSRLSLNYASEIVK